MGELFPSFKSQMQGGYMDNVVLGRLSALEARVLLFFGKNCMTIRQNHGGNRSWDTDPVSTV